MMPIITLDQGERSVDKKISSVICITNVNVRTMKDCSNEIVKILSRRQKDVCCVQELWWIGESAWINYGDKFSWKGNNSGNGGVEVLVVKKWIDKVIGSMT